jgi:hypothetical protein
VCFSGRFRGTGVDAQALRGEVIRRGGVVYVGTYGNEEEETVAVRVE